MQTQHFRRLVAQALVVTAALLVLFVAQQQSEGATAAAQGTVPTAVMPPTTTPTTTATAIPTVTLTPNIRPSPTATPLPGAPEPVELVPTHDQDLFNILLLGSDRRTGATHEDYRTDTMIVVSINRGTNSVNMLSIPRDIYLYVPGYGYSRINTASFLGDYRRWPGDGDALIAEAITYSLGIRIDRRARVNFAGFRQIIDQLGGVDIPVDCPITDYRLASPTLDPNVEDNYKLWTLPIGMHHMNGDLALWYVRSRKDSIDYERNRRQQQVLRAMYRKIREEGLLEQIPMLWDQVTQVVHTDLSLQDVIGLVPVALNLDQTTMRHYFITSKHLSGYVTPEGWSVTVPKPEEIRRMVDLLYLPPTRNHLSAEESSMLIYNGTANPAWDRVAADRLAWEGFAAVPSGFAEPIGYEHTTIIDYTGGAKPRTLDRLKRILFVHPANIKQEPDPNAVVDFEVVLGASYNACNTSPWRVGPAQ